MRIRLFSLLLLASTPALAQTHDTTQVLTPVLHDPGFAQGGDAIPALPLEVMKSGTISYINGGIGDEELAQFKQQSAQYNLHLMLSATNGDYVSNIHVRVLDSAGAPLLDVPESGPYLYVALPAGSYTLETTNPGEPAKTEGFTITTKKGFTKHLMVNQ